jgi:hypothetical protein
MLAAQKSVAELKDAMRGINLTPSQWPLTDNHLKDTLTVGYA